jgi:hypothetical protein
MVTRAHCSANTTPSMSSAAHAPCNRSSSALGRCGHRAGKSDSAAAASAACHDRRGAHVTRGAGAHTCASQTIARAKNDASAALRQKTQRLRCSSFKKKTIVKVGAARKHPIRLGTRTNSDTKDLPRDISRPTHTRHSWDIVSMRNKHPAARPRARACTPARTHQPQFRRSCRGPRPETRKQRLLHAAPRLLRQPLVPLRVVDVVLECDRGRLCDGGSALGAAPARCSTRDREQRDWVPGRGGPVLQRELRAYPRLLGGAKRPDERAVQRREVPRRANILHASESRDWWPWQRRLCDTHPYPFFLVTTGLGLVAWLCLWSCVHVVLDMQRGPLVYEQPRPRV